MVADPAARSHSQRHGGSTPRGTSAFDPGVLCRARPDPRRALPWA